MFGTAIRHSATTREAGTRIFQFKTSGGARRHQSHRDRYRAEFLSIALLRNYSSASGEWSGPAAKVIAVIGPHDRHLPTKETSRVVHDPGIPDGRLYRGRTEVGAVHHLRNGPLPRAR